MRSRSVLVLLCLAACHGRADFRQGGTRFVYEASPPAALSAVEKIVATRLERAHRPVRVGRDGDKLVVDIPASGDHRAVARLVRARGQLEVRGAGVEAVALSRPAGVEVTADGATRVQRLSIRLTADDAARVRATSEKLVGKQLTVVVDGSTLGRVQVSGPLEGAIAIPLPPISDPAEAAQESADLVALLSSGPLPAALTNTVQDTLPPEK